MNVKNKKIGIIFLFCTFISFSQKKQNVYFILEDDNPQYSISHIMFGEKTIGFINLSNRKEYEHYQKKIKEAKKRGEYYFDPEGGADNLNIKVSKLTFEILSRKKIKLEKGTLTKLKLVNYKWLNKNSWKPIAKQPYNFKDIYFLSKIDNNNYISYKVGVTIIAF